MNNASQCGMRMLIAEDDPVPRRLLEAVLVKWGYEVVVACDGIEAWQVLRREDAPRLAVLDWMMPGMDGVEVCRKVRTKENGSYVYLILLTIKQHKEDTVAGLDAGADDYVIKPFDHRELRARVQVGVRMVDLQRSLTEHVSKLENALSQVKQLQGLLPICSYCKKIRDDRNYWHQVEAYVGGHSEAEFTHGICPDCYEKFVEPQLDRLERNAR